MEISEDKRIVRMTEDNPARKVPCRTPKGDFASLSLAAKAYGMTRQAVHLRIKRESNGWAYAEI